MINRHLIILLVLFLMAGAGCSDRTIETIGTNPAVTENPIAIATAEPSGELVNTFSIKDNYENTIIFTAGRIDDYGNGWGLSFQYNSLSMGKFTDWKQSLDIDPHVIQTDLNNDGNKEFIVYLTENTEEGEIVEKLYFLDLDSGQEINIDEINKTLSSYERIQITHERLRSGIKVNNQYHYFIKAFLEREISLTEENFTDHTAYKKTVIGQELNIEVIRLFDSLFANTSYLVSEENMSKAMNNWISTHTTNETIIIKKDNLIEIHYWNVDDAICSVDLKDIEGDGSDEVVLVFDQLPLLKDQQGNVYIENLEDDFKYNIMWFSIISTDGWVMENEGVSIASIEKEGSKKQTPMGIALKINNEMFVFNDWSGGYKYTTVELTDLNNDREKELVIKLSGASGTGVSSEYIFFLDTSEYKQLSMQNPIEVINERFDYSVTKTDAGFKLDIFIDGEQVSSQIIKYNSWLDNIEGLWLGAHEHYSIDDDKLTTVLSASYSPTGFAGKFYAEYVMDDISLTIENIWYEADDSD